MVQVPVRLDPVHEATEYPTVPLPDPLDPEVMVIQLALLEAVQVQPEVAVTLTVPVPPLAPKVWLVGESE
jgi:hypothetical protein